MKNWKTLGLSVLVPVALGLMSGCGSSYQVEYKTITTNFFMVSMVSLEVTVKGKAQELAVLLIDPKGNTNTEFISKEQMIDNIEKVNVLMHKPGETPEPGTYTLLIKTIEPEKVVYKKEMPFTKGRLIIEDVNFEFTSWYGKIKPKQIKFVVRNEGSLPVVFSKLFITMGNQKCDAFFQGIALPGNNKFEEAIHFTPEEIRSVIEAGGLPDFSGSFLEGRYLAQGKLYIKKKGVEKDEFITFKKEVVIPKSEPRDS